MIVSRLPVRVLVAALSGFALLLPYRVAYAAPLQSDGIGAVAEERSQDRINRIAFEGNRKVEKGQLTAVVESQANRGANPLTSAPVVASNAAMR